jgi:prepilin peptidase CpaA
MPSFIQTFISASIGPGPALVLLAVALISAFTDLVHGKIYNAVTYPAILVGVVLQMWLHGGAGLPLALAGFAVGFVPAFVLFVLGGMGGGDVKLLGAIGAIAGPMVATETLILAFLFGGLFALGKLAWHGRLFDSGVRIVRVLAGYVVPGLGRAAAATTPALTVRFGVAICLAALAALWDLRTGALVSLLG